MDLFGTVPPFKGPEIPVYPECDLLLYAFAEPIKFWQAMISWKMCLAFWCFLLVAFPDMLIVYEVFTFWIVYEVVYILYN